MKIGLKLTKSCIGDSFALKHEEVIAFLVFMASKLQKIISLILTTKQISNDDNNTHYLGLQGWLIALGPKTSPLGCQQTMLPS